MDACYQKTCAVVRSRAGMLPALFTVFLLLGVACVALRVALCDTQAVNFSIKNADCKKKYRNLASRVALPWYWPLLCRWCTSFFFEDFFIKKTGYKDFTSKKTRQKLEIFDT